MKKILLSPLALILSFTILAFTGSDNKDFEKNIKIKKDAKSHPDNAKVLKEIFSVSGPFNEFSPNDEEISMRTENSKHFKNSDGTYTALIGAGDIHYKDSGEWKTILSHVYNNNTNNFKDRRFAAPYNNHKIYFPDKPGISIVSQTENGVYEDWEMPKMVWLDKDGKILSEIAPLKSSKGKFLRDSIVYENIYNGIDAQIIISTTSKKLNYIIKDASLLSNVPTGAFYLAFAENIKLDKAWKLSGEKKISELSASKNAIAFNSIDIKDNSGKALINLSQPLYFEKLSLGSCTDVGYDSSKVSEDAYFQGSYLVEEIGNGIYKNNILIPNKLAKQTR